MRRLFLIVPALFSVFGCASKTLDVESEREGAAIEFLRGIYTGDPSVVDRLAAPDIAVSYPIFEELFGAPAIVGREAVRKFAEGFGKRWVDGEVVIHDVVISGDTAVVIWGFRARRAASDGEDRSALAEKAWGGITVYRFDEAGRIAFEVGEESTPGPAARIPDAFPDP